MNVQCKTKKLLIFGGQFDPVHIAHMQILQAAIAYCNPQMVKVIPSFVQKAKSAAIAPFAMRVEMLKLALQECKIVADVDTIECTLAKQGRENGYTIDVLQELACRYPDYTLHLLIGADQFLNFDKWHKPEEICLLASIVVVGRGELQITTKQIEAFQNRYLQKTNTTLSVCNCSGKDISSTQIQAKLAFGYSVQQDMPKRVVDYLQANQQVYQPPILQKGIELLTPLRKEHSYRVAKLALQVASKYHLNRRQVLYAAALHDIAKHLTASHPLLQDFKTEDRHLTDKNPVWHAFAGRYLAEHYLGIQDEDILNAIAFHTTGRANMSMLEKVIYLADMLEEQRNFKNIEILRKIFVNEVDKCLAFALQYTVNYLKQKNIEIYWRTLEAWEYYKRYGNA